MKRIVATIRLAAAELRYLEELRRIEGSPVGRFVREHVRALAGGIGGLVLFLAVMAIAFILEAR